MGEGSDRVGYDAVSSAFVGETITRDGVSLRIVAVGSAEEGYILDAEVDDGE